MKVRSSDQHILVDGGGCEGVVDLVGQGAYGRITCYRWHKHKPWFLGLAILVLREVHTRFYGRTTLNH